jgi:3-hydroxybutyryl-CoA dehydrogenase
MKIGILGAGTMGNGIAHVFAVQKHRVILVDINDKILNNALENIKRNLNRQYNKKLINQNTLDLAVNNITISTDIEFFKSCDLVIEAIKEDLDLKKNIFRKLDLICNKETILASNTSSISINSLAKCTNRPDKVIGMHFMNPVPIMKLLELVKHEKCSEETIENAQSIGEIMGKETILVKDVPGFATSRLGVVLGNEAIRMLAEGVATASDIDKAMKLGYKHPMGPLELSDLVGLDVRRDILNGLADSFEDNSYRPHRLLDSLVAEGSLGKKTNKGIYDWTENGKKERNDLPE